MKISIDPDKLTLGELKAFERYGGSMQNPSSAASLTAFVYLSMKRDDPSVTMEDVEKLTISDLEFDSEVAENLDEEKKGNGTPNSDQE